MTVTWQEVSKVLGDLLTTPDYDPFEVVAAMTHEGQWADVSAKAKRLVSSGQVTILRNAPHHVMAHVVGDHGEYNCEISRHDPGSQIIEQWNCECPWAQFAFDRTRKWKKLEGRVCSHVLATYWKARSTPIDLADETPESTVPTGQTLGPGNAPGQQILPGMTPDQLAEQQGNEVEDQGAEGQELPPDTTPAPPQQPSQLPTPNQTPPSTQDLTIPKAPPTPFQAVPKAQPGPPQREQLHLFDITAPIGMQPTPQAPAVSIPGGRPPTPGNPVQFPGTFSHFIPIMTIHSDHFIYASDPLSDYFETQRAASKPIYVALNNLVTLEQSGGKIPVPGSMPYGVSSENVPLYKVLDLGYNPQTKMRENADVNALQGAPEQTGTYADVAPNRRAEVLDYDDTLKMAYITVPLNYPEGGDIRLHPHSLKGWVDFADIRPVPGAQTPWRSR